MTFARNARAVWSVLPLASKTPLSASTWRRIPAPASSPRVRSASASAVCSGRLTSTSAVVCAVAERADAGGVELALLLQAGERTQARHAGRVGIDESAPGRGQRQQPQRVPGRRGVEDHMVIAGGARRIAEQPHERVRTRRSPRARAGQRVPRCWTGAVRREARGTGRPSARDRARRRLGIDVRRFKPLDPRHRAGLRASAVPSTSSRFGRRVGGDQQHPRPRRPARSRSRDATEVLPVPPLPVKNRTRVGSSSSVDRSLISSPLCRRSSLQSQIPAAPCSATPCSSGPGVRSIRRALSGTDSARLRPAHRR